MKFTFFYLLLCFVGFSAKAQNSSLLWEISGNGLEKPSFVYGTMHWPDKRIFELGDSVLPKLMSCEVMAGELDFKEKPGKETAMRILLQGDSTLKMLLYPDDYLLVKKMAKERLGVLENLVLDRCKPIYVYFMLMQSETKKSKREEVIDEYFQNVARKKGKRVVGLETMDEQISALDAIKQEDQITMLIDYVRNGVQESKELNQMMDIYLSQNLEKLDSFMVHTEMPEEMSQSVVLKRNYVMVERLEKLIKVQSTFIAVGAAHLPGKEGVLELLRKDGYTVRPVVPTFNSGKKVKKKKEKRT